MCPGSTLLPSCAQEAAAAVEVAHASAAVKPAGLAGGKAALPPQPAAPGATVVVAVHQQASAVANDEGGAPEPCLAPTPPGEDRRWDYLCSLGVLNTARSRCTCARLGGTWMDHCREEESIWILKSESKPGRQEGRGHSRRLVARVVHH